MKSCVRVLVLFFSFFATASLYAMPPVMFKINELTERLRSGVAYNVLIDELQRDPGIGQLFDTVVKYRIIDSKDILFHVLAQAFVRRMYGAVMHEESMFSSLTALCVYIEHRYEQVAASLKMYLYFLLSRAERETYNVQLLKYMNVESFFAQLPRDVRVVQFSETNEFSQNFSTINSIEALAAMLLAERTGYMPFMYYYRRTVAHWHTHIFHDNGQNDLMNAIVFQDVVRVRELLDHGVGGLHALRRVLRYCPTSEPVVDEEESDDSDDDKDSDAHYVTYSPDPVHDEICRMLLERVLKDDADTLQKVLRMSLMLRARAEELMPDLTILFSDDI